MFLKSIDFLDYAKIGEKMFELLDCMVKRVGKKNVIQVVTDNTSVKNLCRYKNNQSY